MAGEVESRLPRGVGRTDDVDLIALALGGLARVGAVVDAAADERRESLGLEGAIGDPGGDDDRPGLDVTAVESHRPDRPARLERDDVARQHELCPEAPGLGQGAAGEVGAGEPAGKPR